MGVTTNPAGAKSRRFQFGAAAAALSSVVLATPSLAQKGPTAGPDVIEEGYNFCLDAVAGLDYLRESLAAAGWTIEDDATYGPYQTYINASLLGDGPLQLDVRLLGLTHVGVAGRVTLDVSR